jgi:hypothetical protein
MNIGHYLRVEVVNLKNFVYDTHDLSTIRGGSLMALDAVKDHVLVPESGLPQFGTVTSGASSAILKFNADDPLAVRDRVEEILESKLPSATVVVDVVPYQEDFASCRESLLAKNRWRQMSSPTVRYPQEPGREACAVDKMRPAKHPGKTGERDISSSVYSRRMYGKVKRQSFYAPYFQNPPKFTDDLDQLTKLPAESGLNHKMAVIHIDGNKFGEIQSECKTELLQTDWDATVKGAHKKMLGNILTATVSQPRWTNSEHEPALHRLETLLWGGDEIVWVVPAWTGWELLRRFYEQMSEAAFHEKPLTYSAGLVFCHHNAPIQSIRSLAERLTRWAKDRSESQRNAVAYLVLESFDNAGDDLEAAMRRLLPANAGTGELQAPLGSLLLEGGRMGELEQAILAMKRETPRTKLHAIVHDLLSGRAKDAEARIGAFRKQLDPQAFQQFSSAFPDDPARWVHLLELWGYILTPEEADTLC